MIKDISTLICFPSDIPHNSILGINYSGGHDSAVCIVSPQGEPLFALSLERISRQKQDGRPLDALIGKLPLNRISKVAVSAPYSLEENSEVEQSKFLTKRLPYQREPRSLAHGSEFLENINKIPCEKEFVGHQEAHAYSTFYASSFENALCLTYDGGMSNDMWFGGVFECSRTTGIKPIELFNACKYAKITTLYTFVTALLGFLPNRHEGKITGLAANGQVTEYGIQLLEKWFYDDYQKIEESMFWADFYSDQFIPQLVSSQAKLKPFLEQAGSLKREDLAASIQHFSERHVLEILDKIRESRGSYANICLAGGLFANVKINQKIVESGFENIFIAPPMSDDGAALGAAWYVASKEPGFSPKPLHSMALGPKFCIDETKKLIAGYDICVESNNDFSERIAKLLSDGKIVAIYQGQCEYGPRALGQSSILAPASDNDINHSLNERLGRTEFMPFAPMVREEDAELCFKNFSRISHAAEFMTITANCTALLKETCPAVVHVDGTARPQIIRKIFNPFVHDILTKYLSITGCHAIVNTSFNIHEEPIVCSPEDALNGFFTSALDYLYIDQIGIISFSENIQVANHFLRQRLKNKSNKELLRDSLIKNLDENCQEYIERLKQASHDLNERTEDLIATREVLTERTERLELASKDLLERTHELVETRLVVCERTERLEAALKKMDDKSEE